MLLLAVDCYAPVLAADNWLANEVLTQLAEIRHDVSGLKEQVGQLREDTDALKASAANQRGKVNVTAVDVGEGRKMGQADAAYVIVEFTDYQCPYCARYSRRTFGQLKKEYVDTGKIQYMVKDYPLGFHREARSAAIAASCANEQGAYWEMHEQLFENQGKLNNEMYGQLAEDMDLDLSQFNKCLNDPGHEKRVNEDIALAERIGIQGTPAFLVGRLEAGRLTDIKAISGAQQYSTFARIIDSMVN